MTATTATEQRTSKLNTLAGAIRKGIAVLTATQQEIGALLHEGAALFTWPGESDKFYSWACNVTGWSRSNVKNVMDSVTVLNALNAQQRGKVSDWSTAAIVSLKPVADDKATLRKVVSSVRASKPSPELIREKRDSVAQSSGNGGNGNGGRTRKTEADKTRELAEKIRAHVERTAGGRDAANFKEAVRLISVGAQLVLDNNRNPLMPKAVQFVGLNPAPENNS